MSRKIGFIGCGNMGTAILQGILDSGKCGAADVIVSTKSEESARAKREKYGIDTTTDNCVVAREADILFLAVKPQFYAQVIAQIRDEVREAEIVVTMAPGKTLEWLREQFGKAVKLIRTMPNTPSMVKEGMMGMCVGSGVTDEEVALVRDLCDGFTRTEVVPEHLMDVVTAVSGSSPAYVYMFIEAMADGGCAAGIPKCLKPWASGAACQKSIFDKLPTIFKLFKKFENRFDWTRKTTLTVFFHTFFPSETFGWEGLLTDTACPKPGTGGFPISSV